MSHKKRKPRNSAHDQPCLDLKEMSLTELIRHIEALESRVKAETAERRRLHKIVDTMLQFMNSMKAITQTKSRHPWIPATWITHKQVEEQLKDLEIAYHAALLGINPDDNWEHHTQYIDTGAASGMAIVMSVKTTGKNPLATKKTGQQP